MKYKGITAFAAVLLLLPPVTADARHAGAARDEKGVRWVETAREGTLAVAGLRDDNAAREEKGTRCVGATQEGTLAVAGLRDDNAAREEKGVRCAGAVQDEKDATRAARPVGGVLDGADAQKTEPSGNITYCLPATVLRLEVEAERMVFHAGPYAAYARKYLGISARLKDETTTELTHIRLTAQREADYSRRFVVDGGKASLLFLQLTAQGLVSTGSEEAAPADWRFPVTGEGSFSERGVTSNLTSESATLYRSVKGGDRYGKLAVQQDMVVAKSLEERAKEAADLIFGLRRNRLQIITGDTDATYSGEAMGAALAEISRLETEYLSLFIGYAETGTQKRSYEVLPEKGKDRYVAFRLSQTAGLVAAEELSGKPYVLKLSAAPIQAAEGRPLKGEAVHYRIPAICDAELTDGTEVLLQCRLPVYQWGLESSFPLRSR